MPLRDHFRPPTDKIAPWEAVHGGWPMVIVQGLARRLPRRYVAHPRVHLGTFAEKHEVRVYDAERGQRLVAAIELVSPANKDRPDHRQAFVAKCVALLQNQVSVTIVDVVTTRESNLYGKLLELIGHTDPSLGEKPPPIYAVACRGTKRGTGPSDPWQLEAWLHPLEVGKPLPSLPLWLADNYSVRLDLEESYEETCRALRIP